MAEVKPLHLNANGVPAEIASADTIPLTNLPDLSETIQDAMGAMVADSDTIDATYNDGGGTESLAVKLQMSLTFDSSGVKLSGDASTPGNSKYYGTDSGGTKGFHTLPTASAAEIRTMTAGETTGASKLVYVSASDTVMLADANTESKAAVGFVISSITNAATGSVYLGPGIITGLSGGTAGAKGFLSTTPGDITATPPNGASDIVQPVGYWLTTTIFFFNPGGYAVRAAS
jgi:hypothetical protein